MGIYPDHMPVMTQLVAGEISARKEGENIFLAVGDGFVQITGKRVAILTDMAIKADDIDEVAAAEAMRKSRGPAGAKIERRRSRDGSSGARPRDDAVKSEAAAQENLA